MTSEAQWCSLCYADLREPAPVRERVVAPVAPTPDEAHVPMAMAARNGSPLPSPAGSDHAGLLDRPEPDEPGPVAEAKEGAADPADPAEAKWPCLACGEQVPLSFDSCPACGAGFLAGATTTASTRLPMVGDIGRMSRTQRLMVGFGIAVAVMILLVVIATIFGHVF